MESNQSTLPSRSLGDLLNETFALYGRHFRQFVLIAGTANALIAVLLLPLGSGNIASATDFVLRSFASVYIYAAIVNGVGQAYTIGNVVETACYVRIWRRIVSLTMVGAILVAMLATLMVPLIMTNGLDPSSNTENVGQGVGFAVLLLLASTVMLWIGMYLSMAVQAVTMEGLTVRQALVRSYVLVQRSWWRVFAVNIVFGMVAFGLMLIATVPFAVTSNIVAADDPNIASGVINFLGGVVTGALAPPVVFISGTLLYFDLRVRKENFDVRDLAQDMGYSPKVTY